MTRTTRGRRGDLPAESSERLQRLVTWAAPLAYEALPLRVRRRAALVLVDDLAAAVAARDEPEVSRLHENLLARPGVPESTVFRGGQARTDRCTAALANGVAMSWCELDEGYRVTGCHAGLYALPALLAEAEAGSLRTADVLAALVTAYEITARLARAFRFARMTVHPHAAFAAVGATAAVAAARRADGALMRDALCAAATMAAAGPFTAAASGALVRNVWAGIGGWQGFHCVEWARIGIAGAPDSPYHAFVGGLGAKCDPGEIDSRLGEVWAIDDGFHKLHGCCGYSHSAVEAILDLLEVLPGDRRASDATRIVLYTHWRAREFDNRRPSTTLGARFSLPHIVAATLALGHAGPEAFAPAALDDPVLARLRDRVTLEPFEPELPWPNERPSRVVCEFADGARFEATCLSARGGPDRPLEAAEILDKARRIAAPAYPAFADVAGALVALDRPTLATPWRAVVDRITT